MNSRFLLVAALAFSLPLYAPAANAAVFAPNIAALPLNTPPVGGFASLSPNRRWLTFANGATNAHGSVFYDIWTGRSWSDSRSGEAVSWSEDSRFLLSCTSTQWRIAQLERRESRAIWSQSFIEIPGLTDMGGIAAWSPRTRRLVIAGGKENTQLRFWDGKRWSRAIDWGQALKFPDWYRLEVTPYDLTWSRDGRLLTIRFYGHADRAAGSALHTEVFSVRGTQLKEIWGQDTGEVAWLDNRRMMFKDDDGGLGRANDVDLVVAEPRTGKRRAWKSKVVEWALSPRRDFVVALLSNGDLVRTSTRAPHWQTLQHRAVSQRLLSSDDAEEHVLRLDISPRGDMVALSHLPDGRGLSLFSALPTKPWAVSWKAPVPGVSVLGWTRNHSLPLVQIGNGPGQIVQLQKRPSS